MRAMAESPHDSTEEIAGSSISVSRSSDEPSSEGTSFPLFLKFAAFGMGTSACAAAAGVVPPQGPSEVERSFFTTSNSRDYNIVSNGERLSGPRNVEAARHARSSCGRKQHPAVDPALRGPTGMRQARPARRSYRYSYRYMYYLR